MVSDDWICLDCGHIFREPQQSVMAMNDGGALELAECPECESLAMTRALECDVCGSTIPLEYNWIELKDGTTICEECYIIRSY